MAVARRVTGIKRRAILTSLAAAPLLGGCSLAPSRILIIGGGFGGTAAARALREFSPRYRVTLLETNRLYYAAPCSNLVVGGRLHMGEILVNYDGLRDLGVNVVHDAAYALEPEQRMVVSTSGEQLEYDRVIVATGFEFRSENIEGYSFGATTFLPHAWRAGGQTVLLRRHVRLMPSGGTVLIMPPPDPSRYSLAAYERAGLIADWALKNKPRAKILIVDPKESFPLQERFREAWAERYGNKIEWVGGMNKRVARVDPVRHEVLTEIGERFRGDVVNFIPPQRAGPLTAAAGLRDSSGWCPVNPFTYESTLRPFVHIIGDSVAGGPVPKSAQIAIQQGRLVAQAIAALDAGREPAAPELESHYRCLIAQDFGFSATEKFHVRDGRFAQVAAGASMPPLPADAVARAAEADKARTWLRTAFAENWGAAPAATV